jgi:hypothetical protein
MFQESSPLLGQNYQTESKPPEPGMLRETGDLTPISRN